MGRRGHALGSGLQNSRNTPRSCPTIRRCSKTIHQETGLPDKESSKQRCSYRRVAAESVLKSFQREVERNDSGFGQRGIFRDVRNFAQKYNVISARSSGQVGLFTVRAVHVLSPSERTRTLNARHDRSDAQREYHQAHQCLKKAKEEGF